MPNSTCFHEAPYQPATDTFTANGLLRNTGRDQIGMLDEIILDSRATSLGIHIQSHNSPKRRSNKPMLIGPGAIPVQSGRQGSVWR
jgi:hypothetical protein